MSEFGAVLAARRILQDCMAEAQDHLIGYPGGVGGVEWAWERREKLARLVADENQRAATDNGGREAWA